MNNVLKIAVLLGAVALTACSTTSQQPRTFDQLGRYQSIPLNQNMYRVSFHANGNWDYGISEEIALLKSAQVTVQQGFDAFKVIDDPSNRANEQQQRQTVVYRHRSFYDPFWYGGYDPFYDRPYVVNVEPRDVSYTVQMFKKANAPQDAFDARQILLSLGKKYGVAENGTVIQPKPLPTKADSKSN